LTAQDLRTVLEVATGASAHAYADSLRRATSARAAASASAYADKP
jgi:hypothetical protein